MKYAIKSDIGVVRKENQDRAAVFQKGNHVLAILCDGMGGHVGGAAAATITISVFEKSFHRASVTLDNVSVWFTETIKATLRAMVKDADRDAALLDMGTTLTAAYIFYDLQKVVVFNIGDSRTYVYNGQLQQITRDQNFRNYYMDKYKYTADEASQMAGAAALISALGPRKSPHPDAQLLELDAALRYVVLTSDGVHDYIAKPVLERIVSASDRTLMTKAEELITKAINGRSSDNLTVVILDLQA